MTPKEKANELMNKMKLGWMHSCTHFMAKKCAILCVDEIINSSPSLPILGDGGTFGEDIELSINYWKSVKKELELL
jgi:hypothetical protein